MKPSAKCKGGHHKWYLKAEKSMATVSEIMFFHQAMKMIHAPMVFIKKQPVGIKPYVPKPMDKLFCRNCTKTQLIVIE